MFRQTLKTIVATWIALMPIGCTVPWGVDTTYTINNVDVTTYEVIKDELTAHGFTHEEVGPFTFRVRGDTIPTMRALRQVEGLIRKVSATTNVPVDLDHGQLTFQSVAGHARAELNLRGTRTPGARVYLDVGGAYVEEARYPDEESWYLPVTSARLLHRRGWVYGVITKNDTRQYMKINVMQAGSMTKIERSDIPRDSSLWGRVIPRR